MSMEKARACLREAGLEDRIIEFTVSSATVALPLGARCRLDADARTLTVLERTTL